MNGNTLKDLLPEKLRKDLTPAEEKLLESSQEGAEADFRSGDQEKDNPENSEKWGSERTIRAELLYWLCTDPKAGRRAHAKGIWIWGAKIAGSLDFTSATLPHSIAICKSAIEDIELAYAETRNLNFSGSSIHSIRADGLSANGQLFLIEVTVKGGVRLPGANIGGQLACKKAIFENPRGYAFNADGIAVNGGIIFNKVTAKGEVRFLGAHIRGPLDCIGAIFENHMAVAFNADGLSIEGSVFLSGVTANGAVRLIGAEISSQLDCTGSTFKNPTGKAFSADGFLVKGGMFFNGVRAYGEVRFLGANIHGQLACNGALFENLNGLALKADRISINGSMFLTDITAKGKVLLIGADISGGLDCNGATFENLGDYAFNAQNLEVTQVLFFDMKKTAGILNLEHAKVGVLVDLEASWPEKGNLLLDGFEYGALAGDNTPQTSKKRLEWLRLQPKDSFSLQPYEQLAKVFRNAGRESDAREVLIAKQEDLRHYGKLRWYSKAWNRILGITIGHGYKSGRVFYFIFYFLLLGSIMFCQANKLGVMKSVKEVSSGNPPFNSIIYSIDAFVPFLNLHQEDYWLPNAENTYPYDCKWCCQMFRGYLWFHIAMGWVFSTLAALSLSGLIRKD